LYIGLAVLWRRSLPYRHSSTRHNTTNAFQRKRNHFQPRGECKPELRLFLPSLQSPSGVIFICLEVRSMSRFTCRAHTVLDVAVVSQTTFFKVACFSSIEGLVERPQRIEANKIMPTTGTCRSNAVPSGVCRAPKPNQNKAGSPDRGVL
jgi:hypothetical protein